MGFVSFSLEFSSDTTSPIFTVLHIVFPPSPCCVGGLTPPRVYPLVCLRPPFSCSWPYAVSRLRLSPSLFSRRVLHASMNRCIRTSIPVVKLPAFLALASYTLLVVATPNARRSYYSSVASASQNALVPPSTSRPPLPIIPAEQCSGSSCLPCVR